jgi:hypothetical protein
MGNFSVIRYFIVFVVMFGGLACSKRADTAVTNAQTKSGESKDDVDIYRDGINEGDQDDADVTADEFSEGGSGEITAALPPISVLSFFGVAVTDMATVTRAPSAASLANKIWQGVPQLINILGHDVPALLAGAGNPGVNEIANINGNINVLASSENFATLFDSADAAANAVAAMRASSTVCTTFLKAPSPETLRDYQISLFSVINAFNSRLTELGAQTIDDGSAIPATPAPSSIPQLTQQNLLSLSTYPLNCDRDRNGDTQQ